MTTATASNRAEVTPLPFPLPAEAARILEQTEGEIAKLREQTEGEAARLAQQTMVELRRFSAEESIRRAEQKLRSSIDANADANLVKSGIQAIGGLS